MNWGTGITIVFVVFGISMFSFTFYTMTFDVNLVAPDYYKQELAYEDQITRIKNTKKLEAKPTFSQENGTALLTFPASVPVKSGSILFFRPSDASKDKVFDLKLDKHIQKFNISGYEPGLWKVKLNWTDEQKEYYKEFVVVK